VMKIFWTNIILIIIDFIILFLEVPLRVPIENFIFVWDSYIHSSSFLY